ncbi:MAG: (d)CMP kinase [Candidatus Micrarchaeota archaeon]
MIIAIAGLTGSGKNTVGEFLAKELGVRMVCPTMKDLAKKEGVSLIEFQKMAQKDPNIDLKFDLLLKEECAKGDAVVTTWLGAWITKPDVAIFLNASDNTRAARIVGRDKMSLAIALKHVQERDSQNIKRYKKLYSIDITDTSIFDVVINSDKFTQAQVNELALACVKIKLNKKS